MKAKKRKLKKKRTTGAAGVTGEREWPNKRNILFRPNRMKYVRKIERPNYCVFCRSANEDLSLDTLCLFKSKSSQIVLNKYPYNNGHLLVLPLAHKPSLLELTEGEFSDLHLTLRLAVQAIKSVYNPHGFNLGMNHGATGGAGIPDHLHYHVVPRWNGDLNFFPLIAETKLVVETIQASYEKLNEYFRKRLK